MSSTPSDAAAIIAAGKSTPGRASAPSAPAPNAHARRRHPCARMTAAKARSSETIECRPPLGMNVHDKRFRPHESRGETHKGFGGRDEAI